MEIKEGWIAEVAREVELVSPETVHVGTEQTTAFSGPLVAVALTIPWVWKVNPLFKLAMLERRLCESCPLCSAQGSPPP